MAGVSDPGEVVLSAADWQDIVAVVNRVGPLLDRAVDRRLTAVKMRYLTRYGVRGLYDRVNGRTVAQVLAEFNEPNGRLVAEGNSSGVQYTLHAPADPPVDAGPSAAADAGGP